MEKNVFQIPAEQIKCDISSSSERKVVCSNTLLVLDGVCVIVLNAEKFGNDQPVQELRPTICQSVQIKSTGMI